MNANEIAAIAAGVVTPNCVQVIVTVVAVVVTGTVTLVPQLEPVHVPQFLGLFAESKAGFIVLGVETCIVSPTVPVPLETGPTLPDTVKEMPV